MAQCIFCKSTENRFTSIEHIVPESLGNSEHVLPRGIVCDKCNNYFARKIEGPILGSDYFRQARHRNAIESKRNRVPTLPMLTFPDAMPIEMGIDRDGDGFLMASKAADNDRFVSQINSQKRFTAIHSIPDKPDTRLFARFLLLMGLEYLAFRFLDTEDGIAVDHINNPRLDPARAFCRFNDCSAEWAFHETQLYPEGKRFLDVEQAVFYDVPHEFTLLYTSHAELFFVIAIFGTQYTINLGSPCVAGFRDWLNENENASPLYPNGT